ncbi:hypothetical protein QQS21_004202 [Conoideocrella luteorostrata]|uniref:DUF1993 domain-containing protein n=1 Tax=Conoideocrella luteorostrata TaxID=1105319 RepID=A0AAJ0CRT9_9HYPO|nr:hypothetical protein QQS21_004202 [Conoideocrella luteorostrata]
MSSFTFYTASISEAAKALDALTRILKKGQEATNAATLPSASIYEDMLPLTMQVSIACAHANKLVSRTTGVEIPTQENNLRSFDDMHARIAQTQQLIAKATMDVVNKSVNEITAFPIGYNRTADLPIAALATDYYLPNIFFHAITAYNILRKEGVPLGKADYEDAFMALHMTQ